MLKTKQGSDPRRRHAADEALQRFAKTVLKTTRGGERGYLYSSTATEPDEQDRARLRRSSVALIIHCNSSMSRSRSEADEQRHR